MVSTQYLCAAYGSKHIRRNGSSQSHAKYQCTACGHQARFVPVAVERAPLYAQVEKLLVERNSQCSIVRVTGVVRMMVAKLIKKSVGGRPALAPLATEKGLTPGVKGARTR